MDARSRPPRHRSGTWITAPRTAARQKLPSLIVTAPRVKAACTHYTITTGCEAKHGSFHQSRKLVFGRPWPHGISEHLTPPLHTNKYQHHPQNAHTNKDQPTHTPQTRSQTEHRQRPQQHQTWKFFLKLLDYPIFSLLFFMFSLDFLFLLFLSFLLDF